MARCDFPGCDWTGKKAGVPIHKARMHDIHPMRAEPIAEPVVDRVNPLEGLLAKPLYEAKRYRKVKSMASPLGPATKKGIRERLGDTIFEDDTREPKPRRKFKLPKVNLPKRKPRTEPVLEQGEPIDPEPLLDMLYRLPAVFILFGGFIFVWTKWDMIIQLGNHPLIEFYGYLLLTISEPISIILLAITGLAMYLVGTVLYRFVWRMMFPDLQLKSYKEVPVMSRTLDGKWAQIETKKIFMPPTRRGRIYLMVGRGRWDRLYRKRTGRPRPDTVTIYYRDFSKTRNPFANPFKVLASCEKGYLKDPAGTRLQKDGLFRRTLIATHMRRDTENETTVWWFENEPYEHKAFKSEPYVHKHSSLIDSGLGKVSQACGMDSSVQKDQMRNSVSYLPKQMIIEDAQMTKLKETTNKE